MTRHVLEIDDLTAAEITRVLDLADAPDRPPILAGQSVGLYFEKPSLRTRHSTEAAVTRLGGHAVTFTDAEPGTLVRLVHSGWAEGSEEVRARYTDWEHLLSRFAAFVS